MPGPELAVRALSQPSPGQASCSRTGVQAQAGTGGHRLSPTGAGLVKHQHMRAQAAWGFRGSRGSCLNCWAQETKGLGDDWGRKG